MLPACFAEGDSRGVCGRLRLPLWLGHPYPAARLAGTRDAEPPAGAHVRAKVPSSSDSLETDLPSHLLSRRCGDFLCSRVLSHSEFLGTTSSHVHSLELRGPLWKLVARLFKI